MPLLLFGVALTSSNRYFTLLENEVLGLTAAAQPLGTVLSSYWSGASGLNHPPLFELLMQFWMHATDGGFDYLRIPAILFYIAGILFLALTARRVVGIPSSLAVLWMGILWPFGFLHGRLALSYTLSFVLVAGLTLAYFRYLEAQTFNRWAILFTCAAALLWTSYWALAILGYLAIDQFLRRRAGETTIDGTTLIRTGALLAVAFVPVAREFWRVLRWGLAALRPPKQMLAHAIYSIYIFFAGDAVAPWHWQLSIPAAVGMFVAMVIVCMIVKGPVRRLLIYGGSLMIVMALTVGTGTEQILLAGPWILIPIGVALRADQPTWERVALPASLVLFAGVGWIGVYSMRNYATPQFLDPWPTVAQDVADKVRTGASVVSNSPTFFMYLSYALQNPLTEPNKKLDGVLPDQIHDERIQSPDQWLAAKHPLGQAMIWVRGMGPAQFDKPIDAASKELDHDCGARNSRLQTPDAGYAWKQKYLSDSSDLQWRIEIRQYDCVPDDGKTIFTIPLR